MIDINLMATVMLGVFFGVNAAWIGRALFMVIFSLVRFVFKYAQFRWANKFMAWVDKQNNINRDPILPASDKRAS